MNDKDAPHPHPLAASLLRRQFMQLVGGATGAAAASLAGCGGSSGESDARLDGASPGPDGGAGSDASFSERGAADRADAGTTDARGIDGGEDAPSREAGAADAPAETGGQADVRDDAEAADGGRPQPSVSLGEAVRAIRDFLNAQGGKPRAERLENVLAFLRQRSDIVAAESNEDGVWATFANRVPLMILENRVPEAVEPDPLLDQEPLPPLDALVKGTLPAGNRARLINTMGAGFIDETIPVRKLLARKDYRVSSQPGTVEGLRGLVVDGALYFSAHAGLCETVIFDEQSRPRRDAAGALVKVKTFGVWTSTPFDESHLRPGSPYVAELEEGALGIGVAVESYVPGTNREVFAEHYWITSVFVEKHWTFTPDALAWLAGCKSKAPFATPFVEACFAKGAALYVGWTADVADKASVFGAKFVLDRLLGANLSAPLEMPPQRSFDYVAVWGELRKRGLHLHPNPKGGTTELVYQAKGGSDFSQLAPSIAYLLVDEVNDQLILRGQFGNEPPPGQRAVMIGALEATGVQWGAEEIRANLPRSGPGSSGEVYVSVRAHDSNVRRLSEWTFVFRYRWWMAELEPCVAKGALTVRFRADVGPYRELPGTEPLEPVRYAIGTRDSGGTITASGSHVDGDCTMTWSGAGTLVPAGYGGTPDTSLISWARIDPKAKQLSIGLAFGLASAEVTPWTMTQTCSGGGSFSSKFAISFGLLEELVEFRSPVDDTQPGPTFTALVVALDDAVGTTAGAFEEIAGDLHTRFDWDPVAASSPPEPKAAC